jgi:hypothetical protein
VNEEHSSAEEKRARFESTPTPSLSLTHPVRVGFCTSDRLDHDRQDHLALPCYRQTRRRWDGSCLRSPGRNSGPAPSFEVSSPRT